MNKNPPTRKKWYAKYGSYGNFRGFGVWVGVLNAILVLALV